MRDTRLSLHPAKRVQEIVNTLRQKRKMKDGKMKILLEMSDTALATWRFESGAWDLFPEASAKKGYIGILMSRDSQREMPITLLQGLLFPRHPPVSNGTRCLRPRGRRLGFSPSVSPVPARFHPRPSGSVSPVQRIHKGGPAPDNGLTDGHHNVFSAIPTIHPAHADRSERVQQNTQTHKQHNMPKRKTKQNETSKK